MQVCVFFDARGDHAYRIDYVLPDIGHDMSRQVELEAAIEMEKLACRPDIFSVECQARVVVFELLVGSVGYDVVGWSQRNIRLPGVEKAKILEVGIGVGECVVNID
jgi:hypothetical protein